MVGGLGVDCDFLSGVPAGVIDFLNLSSKTLTLFATIPVDVVDVVAIPIGVVDVVAIPVDVVDVVSLLIDVVDGVTLKLNRSLVLRILTE